MYIGNRRLGAVAAVLCAAIVVGCGSSSNNKTTSSASAPAAQNTKTTGTSAAQNTATTGTSTAQSTATSGASPAGADAAIVKLVPAAIKSKGTLTVAADASYAPDEFFASDGKTVIGMDADLSKAIAALMGLKANVQNQTFTSIIPGLAAGKYDMGASSFGDTKAREKVVTFVDYYKAGESFFTKASGGTDISGIADLCGKSVALEQGTTELADAQTQSKKCKAAGKPGVNTQAFTDQNGANLALASGRAQLDFADTPVAAYAVKKSHGQFKLTGSAVAVVPYGLALPKKSGLAPAVQAAVKELMKNGTYMKILRKWGLQGGAINSAGVKIDGAVS